MKLWMKIVIGLLLGVLAGSFIPGLGNVIKPIGTLFINAIKMMTQRDCN